MYGRADGMPSCPQSVVVCDGQLFISSYIHELWSDGPLPGASLALRLERGLGCEPAQNL